MAPPKNYSDLIEKYPQHISKEQFYKIAHVSKRTACSLLKMGLIKHTDNGRKTRKYTIAMTDVIRFLEDREENPAKYKGLLQSKVVQCVPIHLTSKEKKALETFYSNLFDAYPDVVDVKQVSEMTGHSFDRIREWCRNMMFERFYYQRSYLVPKICLIGFLASEDYYLHPRWSSKQIDDWEKFMQLVGKSDNN